MRDIGKLSVLLLARHVEVEEARIQAMRRAEAQTKRVAAALEVEAADRALRDRIASEQRGAPVLGRRFHTYAPSPWRRLAAWFGFGSPATQSASSGRTEHAVVVDAHQKLERLRQVDALVMRKLAEAVAGLIELRCDLPTPPAPTAPSPATSDRQPLSPVAKTPAGRWGNNGHD